MQATFGYVTAIGGPTVILQATQVLIVKILRSWPLVEK